ncbi:CLUMA_CG019661, isoform A [Clunio marinus]|uniref:CLUMA_CG019661, isoform A n=1 Tax=Clunio marinus TaxID=568069 RepID=A0A1J1J2G0_9DIPT|nr:CLUMA_CG019661, isoform A [Clunio marinus]
MSNECGLKKFHQRALQNISTKSSTIVNTYDMRPPRNATGPISLIFRWHESNRPEVVVGAVAVGPIICADLLEVHNSYY